MQSRSGRLDEMATPSVSRGQTGTVEVSATRHIVLLQSASVERPGRVLFVLVWRWKESDFGRQETHGVTWHLPVGAVDLKGRLSSKSPPRTAASRSLLHPPHYSRSIHSTRVLHLPRWCCGSTVQP
jgi:hypothetical protein